MKKFIKNYWGIIVFVLTFAIDTNYGILEKIITDPFYVKIIRGLGGVLLAAITGGGLRHYYSPKSAFEEIRKLASKDIGGGGIKNPKK